MEQKHMPLQLGSKYTSGGTTSQYIISELGEQSIAINTWTDLESIAKGSAIRNFIVTSVNNHQKLIDALKENVLQLEYMQDKFGETGTGNAVISRTLALLHSFETETEPIKL